MRSRGNRDSVSPVNTVGYTDDDEEVLPTPPPKPKRQVPRWRKLLDKRNDDEAANKYTVKYAGRSWVPKMKPKDQRRRLVIDDSEDLTE